MQNMLANRILLSSLVLLSLIPGFAQFPAPPSGPCKVVVYRPRRFVASGLTPSVYFDGIEVFRLDNGRYVSLDVPPGKHVVKSNTKNNEIAIEAKPGETVYLELVMVSGTWKASGRISPVIEEEGKEQVKKLKLLDVKWLGTGDSGTSGGGSGGGSGSGSSKR